MVKVITIMQRLKLAFFRSLVFILGVELLALVLGIWWLTKGSGHLPIIGLLLCFSVIPLVGNILWLFRFFKGHILYHTSLSILMDGGKLSFAEPASPYEVWLFCKIPFSRYQGQVSITDVSAVKICTVEVARHNPTARSLRSDCTPIVLRPQFGKLGVSRQCCLTLHLRPAPINASISEIFPSENMASITVMVKSA